MKTTKSRIIFFAVALTYNLLLGLYLRDFLILSQTLVAFYLLSVLPTFFLLTEARSRAMTSIVYIVLGLNILMNLVYFVCCRRLLPVITMVLLVVELMCFITFANQPRKDKLLTKICVLAITALILVTMIFACNFVCKQEAPYLNNGGATLWDTQTEELANEICASCETDEEKVQAIYQWIIQNFEYDHDYYAFIQYFNARRTLHTSKGVCYDFSNLFAALCRSQNIPCYVIDGSSYDTAAHHTWNRVYYDNSWWNVDVTNDMSASKNNENIYGFHKLESSHSSDAEYRITKIY